MTPRSVSTLGNSVGIQTCRLLVTHADPLTCTQSKRHTHTRAHTHTHIPTHTHTHTHKTLTMIANKYAPRNAQHEISFLTTNGKNGSIQSLIGAIMTPFVDGRIATDTKWFHCTTKEVRTHTHTHTHTYTHTHTHTHTHTYIHTLTHSLTQKSTRTHKRLDTSLL
jgi:hypothetical protein